MSWFKRFAKTLWTGKFEPTPYVPIREPYIELQPKSDAVMGKDWEAVCDKPDGTYVDVWGPLKCNHCGYPWGGSGYSGRGVVFHGHALHVKCYPEAVQVALATEKLSGV